MRCPKALRSSCEARGVGGKTNVESDVLGYTDAEGTKPEKNDTNSGNLEMVPEVDEKSRFKVQRL